jgi:hypothetical protein
VFLGLRVALLLVIVAVAGIALAAREKATAAEGVEERIRRELPPYSTETELLAFLDARAVRYEHPHVVTMQDLRTNERYREHYVQPDQVIVFAKFDGDCAPLVRCEVPIWFVLSHYNKVLQQYDAGGEGQVERFFSNKWLDARW